MRNCQPRPLEDKPKGRAPAEAWVCAAIRQRLHLRPQQQLPAVGISYVLGVVPETASTERGPLRLPGRPPRSEKDKEGQARLALLCCLLLRAHPGGVSSEDMRI